MVNFYLLFDGCCAEAIKAYEGAFGANVLEMQKYGDVPNPGFEVAEADRDKVLHARVELNGATLMCADSGERTQSGDNMYISVNIGDVDVVRKAWDILKDGGDIHMELAPTFFAKLHGSLRDRFGVNWMFSAM